MPRGPLGSDSQGPFSLEACDGLFRGVGDLRGVLVGVRGDVMRWLARVFARAFVRRVAYVLAAVLLAVLGMGKAWAADQGQAYQQCLDALAGHVPTSIPERGHECRQNVSSPTSGWYDAFFQYDTYGDGRWQDGSLGTFGYDSMCSSRQDETGWLDPDSNDDTAPAYCFNGCKYEGASATGSPGEPVTWVATGTVCTGADVPPAVVDTDGDGVPDVEDAFPNDPNESKDTDGDGIGDNADIADGDPTNGDDKQDGDEKDNQAGGGGDCNAPPTCTGDAIACNTNWQIWRMRCGTGGAVTGDVTNCAAAYTCNADPVQCAQLAVMRVEACKAGQGDGDGTGEGVDDQPAWTKGAEPPRPDEGAEPAESDVKRFGVGIGPDLLDREEIFGAGSCPVFPSFEIMGVTIDPSDIDSWCTIVAVMRAAVLLMAGYFALQILMGRVV